MPRFTVTDKAVLFVRNIRVCVWWLGGGGGLIVDGTSVSKKQKQRPPHQITPFSGRSLFRRGNLIPPSDALQPNFPSWLKSSFACWRAFPAECQSCLYHKCSTSYFIRATPSPPICLIFGPCLEKGHVGKRSLPVVWVMPDALRASTAPPPEWRGEKAGFLPDPCLPGLPRPVLGFPINLQPSLAGSQVGIPATLEGLIVKTRQGASPAQ